MLAADARRRVPRRSNNGTRRDRRVCGSSPNGSTGYRPASRRRSSARNGGSGLVTRSASSRSKSASRRSRGTARRPVAIGTTSAQSNSSRKHVLRRHEVGETELVARPAAVAGASVADEVDDVRRDRGARDLGRAPRSRPTVRAARAAAPGRRAARPATAWPRPADDVARSVERASRSPSTIARRGVVGMQQRERRIGERAHRNDREAQQPAQRARHVRTDHRRVPQRADRDAGAQRDALRPRLRRRAASGRTACAARARRLRRAPTRSALGGP